MWRGLMLYPEIGKYDLSSIRLIANGAMYMPADMRKKLLEFFPNAGLFDIYGMTEASLGVTILGQMYAYKNRNLLGSR